MNIKIERNDKPKKDGRFSKRIVLLCIFLPILYTGICLAMQWFTGTQPESQLTVSFFAFISVELWSLSKIKRDEVKKENKGSDE